MPGDTLTHGTTGFIAAYGLTLVAMGLTLVARRAAIGTLLLSPIAALHSALIGALLASIVTAAVPRGMAQLMTGVGVLLLPPCWVA